MYTDGFKNCYCWHTVKWFWVWQSKSNSSICAQLNGFKHCYIILIIQFNINVFFTQLNGFKYTKWLRTFTGPIVECRTRTTTSGQSEPVSNGNEEILHILQSSKTGASQSECLVSYPGYSLRMGGGANPTAEMELAYSDLACWKGWEWQLHYVAVVKWLF